jgi:hypothetical protein
MNKFIVLRMAFALLTVGLMAFSLVPNLPAHAQDKDSCRTDTEGWTQIDATQTDLRGKWTWVASTNCRNDWKWTGVINISGEKRNNYTTVFDSEIDVQLSGRGVVFHRDVSKSAGKDKNSVSLQTWVGKLEQHEDGRIRIYGRWSGAFDYLIPDGYNKDFKMIKQ